jgi:hypothetical protein
MSNANKPQMSNTKFKLPTEEKLKTWSDSELKIVRDRAASQGVNDLANTINEILEDRAQLKTRKSGQKVVEFHFVCKDEKNLTSVPGGQFRSGNWVVSEEHCDPAVRIGAKVALHREKSEPSYFQGTIIGWERVTIPDTDYKRVAFFVEPTDGKLDWAGDGSGEKGYRWG